MSEPVRSVPQSTDLWDLALVVADRVEILNVALREAVTRRATLARVEAGGFELRQTFGLEKVDRNTDAKTLTVGLRFALDTTRGGEIESEQTLHISALYDLTYSIDTFDGIDKEHLDAFGSLNGPYNAWPFWREFVMQATGRMGVRPVIIPVFRFPKQKTPPSNFEPHELEKLGES